MTKTGWLGLLIIIVIVAGGLFFWWDSAAAPRALPAPSGNTASMPTSAQATDQSAPAQRSGGGTAGAPMSATVTYDGNSFSPASVTIAQGGTVTFTDTSGQMWIASDPHPVHTGYDGTSFSEHCAAGYSGPVPLDQCSPGATFSFTFDKAGTWGYHDHLNRAARGTVVVVSP